MTWVLLNLIAVTIFVSSPRNTLTVNTTDYNMTDFDVTWNVTQVTDLASSKTTMTTTTTTTKQPTTKTVTESQVTKLSHLVMDLGVRLHKILRRQHPKKNFVFSPFCLATGLSMIYAGSSGATKEQIRKLLGLDSSMSDQDLHHTFSHVNKMITTDVGNTSVNLANAIFSGEDVNFKQKFTELVRNIYSGETFSLDLNNADKSLRNINEWISNQTNNMINDAVKLNYIHPPVYLLLLSVAHFQGSWTFPFEAQNTKLKKFYLAPNIGKDMYMMHKEKHKLYYGDVPSLKSKILELPFEGDVVSLYIILPNDITGLPEVEAFMTSGVLWRDLGRMVSIDVELILPRFKLETEIQLHSSLGALGAEFMLSPSVSQLSGIADGPNLFVSGMTQNSVFELTEKGVESASLIGQQIALSAINSVYQVTVDHPFFFFILDKRAKITLFMGRVVFPPEGSDSLADLGLLHQMDLSGSNNLDISLFHFVVCFVIYELAQLTCT